MFRKLCYYGWNQTDCYKMMEKMKIVINQELIKLNVLILGESQLEMFTKQEILVAGLDPIMLF